jgi:hypothetical protein
VSALTASPPSPPEIAPTGKGRSLLGFYVAMLVLLAAVGGLGLAWTPLRVWYWERQTIQAAESESGSFALCMFGRLDTPRTRAARRLADVGPAAEQAFRRLLRNDNERFRLQVLSAFGYPSDSWAVPLLIEQARNENALTGFVAVTSLKSIVPGAPGRFMAYLGSHSYERERAEFMDWWTREGREKYGGGSQ